MVACAFTTAATRVLLQGHFTSSDGVHWTDNGIGMSPWSVCPCGTDDAADSMCATNASGSGPVAGIGSGSAWAVPGKKGKYVINYSTNKQGDQYGQEISFSSANLACTVWCLPLAAAAVACWLLRRARCSAAALGCYCSAAVQLCCSADGCSLPVASIPHLFCPAADSPMGPWTPATDVPAFHEDGTHFKNGRWDTIMQFTHEGVMHGWWFVPNKQQLAQSQSYGGIC